MKENILIYDRVKYQNEENKLKVERYIFKLRVT